MDEITDAKSLLQLIDGSCIEDDKEYYLVSKEWFNRWKSHVESDEAANSTLPHPGPIDNSSLLESSGGANEAEIQKLQLRQGLTQGSDFIVLHKDFFEAMVRLNSIVDKSHTVVRKAIDVGEFYCDVSIEIYPPLVTVTLLNSKLVESIVSSLSLENPTIGKDYRFVQMYSMKTSAIDILNDASQRLSFQVDQIDEDYIRMWCLNEGSQHFSDSVLPSWSKAIWEVVELVGGTTLSSIKIKPCQELVIEVRKNTQSKWPKDQYCEELESFCARQKAQAVTKVVEPESEEINVQKSPLSSTHTESAPSALHSSNPDCTLPPASKTAPRNIPLSVVPAATSIYTLVTPKEAAAASPRITEPKPASQSTAKPNLTSAKSPAAALQKTSLPKYTPTPSSSIASESRSKSTPSAPQLPVATRSPYEPGLCGLSNMGNTCYMNSALQTMLHCGLLTDYFLKQHDQILAAARDQSNTRLSRVVAEYARLTKRVWSGLFEADTPELMKNAIGDVAPSFKGGDQQDAQELLAVLLDKLHEGLNEARGKPRQLESDTSNEEPDHVKAEKSWKSYRSRENSVIVDLFHGQLKNTIVCPDCGHKSVKFDPFVFLSLPIPVCRSIRLTFVPLGALSCSGTRKFVAMRLTVDNLTTVSALSQAACNKLNGIDVMLLDLPVDSASSISSSFSSSASLCLRAEDLRLHAVDKHKQRMDSQVLPLNANFGDDRFAQVDHILVFQLPSSQIYSEFRCLVQVHIYGGKDLQCAKWSPLFWLKLEQLKTTCDFLVSAIQQFVGRILSFEDAALANFYICERANWKSRLNIKKVLHDGENSQKDLLAVLCDWLKTLRSDVPTAADDKALRYIEKEIVFAVESSAINLLDCNLDEMIDRSNFRVHIDKSLQPTDHLERSHNTTLENCLALFTKEEQLRLSDSWLCSRCRKEKAASKKFDFWYLPPILIVQLKRFGTTVDRLRDDTSVQAPIKGLDFSPYLVSPSEPRKTQNSQLCGPFSHAMNEGPPLYDLVAVSMHYGDLYGGHYTAACENYRTGRWYEFNDSHVKAVTSLKVIQRSAYLLVYQRRAVSNLGQQSKQTYLPNVPLPLHDGLKHAKLQPESHNWADPERNTPLGNTENYNESVQNDSGSNHRDTCIFDYSQKMDEESDNKTVVVDASLD